jgi:hypothetical protein
LSQKFVWLLEKTGRKWTLKKGSIQVITHFLKMIGEVEFLINEMEKTLDITFGIGGIKTIETQTVLQELDRIQDYNSPQGLIFFI